MGFRQYGIEELNRVLRNKLIHRWVTLGRSDWDDEALYREVDARERVIDTLLGKRLLPAYPIIVLSILQALESGRNLNTASGSYGELYEALITDRLVTVSRKPTDLGTKYTLIARLAYFFYQKDVNTATVGDIAAVCDEYFQEYRIRIDPSRFLEEMLTADLLREGDGNFGFKYSYYYHFFVARYFRDNLTDPRHVVELRSQLVEMADRVYYEAYANILVFYLYLTKDPQIIERIVCNAEQIYHDYEPATLEEDAAFVNRLYVTPPRPMELPGSDVAEHRDERRRQIDAAEEAGASLSRQGERVAYSDGLDDFVKINIALKTVHILGQVLRNFPGSLRGEAKVRIAEQCYMLGLRVLGFVLSAVQHNEDGLRRYYSELMRDQQPALSPLALGQSAEEAIITLVELWCFAMIKTLSHSVGMEDLVETYKEVLARHSQTLSVQMIDTSIKLDHFWSFPEAQVDSLHRQVRQNMLAYSVLRALVAHYLYLYRTIHMIRQKYTKVFEIKTGREVLLLEGGLSKSSEPE
jgi:hypothetical protein